MRVAVCGELEPGQFGGIEQNLLGLLHALGQFDREDEFVITTLPSAPDWPHAVLGPNMKLQPIRSSRKERLVAGLRARLAPNSPVRRALRGAKRTIEPYRVLDSNGRYEQTGADVVHFPFQDFARTELPSIYCPHDLQHIHLPQFFDDVVIADREILYGTGCREATAVVVESNWVRDDLVRHYSIPPEKVFVIPTAAPTSVYEGLAPDTSVLRRAGIARNFAFYPAVTWPHKNHIRLLQALALLRDRGVTDLDLVCSGKLHESHWPKVADEIARLKLADRVHFVGFVSPAELLALYQRAEQVVIPTLFESVSAPMWEAWHQRTPVACSNVTALPEQAGDAALIFDPLDVESIATAVESLHGDADARRRLIEHGAKRLCDFDWQRTASAYRALYRKVSGCKLDVMAEKSLLGQSQEEMV